MKHRRNRNGYLVFKNSWRSYAKWKYQKVTGYKLKKNEGIHHINHNRTDNRISNLRVVTQNQNNRLHGHSKKDIGRFQRRLKYL